MTSFMNLKFPKTYKCTKSNKYITEEQRDFYEQNGYLVFRNLVDHGILDECKHRFIDICENRVAKDKETVLVKDAYLKLQNVKGEKLINKIQYLSQDDVFFKYIKYEPMIDIIESIIGPNISTVHNMVINKPPNPNEIVSSHPLHQDLLYFPIGPADSVLTAWTAMENADEKNGCLFVIPGTHKYGLKEHEYPQGDTKTMYRQIKNENLTNGERIFLPMEKGDTVIFHSLLFHGSLPNFTKGFRKAISSQYADSNCYFTNVKGTIQENVIRDMVQINIKLGKSNTIEEYSRLKARLVRGSPENFQRSY